MLEYVSRAMLVLHSHDVVSGWPVPMYLACSRSSSCWVRNLSAYVYVLIIEYLNLYRCLLVLITHHFQLEGLRYKMWLSVRWDAMRWNRELENPPGSQAGFMPQQPRSCQIW